MKFLQWLLLSEKPTMERLCAQIWTWEIFWGWILDSYWWMIFTLWMRSPWKVGSGVGGSVHTSQVDSLPRLVSVSNWKRLNSEINVNVKFTHSVFYESPRSSSLSSSPAPSSPYQQLPLWSSSFLNSEQSPSFSIDYRLHFLLRNHHPHHHHRHEHWRKSREPILAREWLFHLSSKNPPPALRAFCIYPIFISCFEVTFLIAVTIKDVMHMQCKMALMISYVCARKNTILRIS